MKINFNFTKRFGDEELVQGKNSSQEVVSVNRIYRGYSGTKVLYIYDVKRSGKSVVLADYGAAKKEVLNLLSR